MKQASVSSILVAVVLLVAGVMAEAQQQAKVFKLGWLTTDSTQQGRSESEIIQNGLRPLGYVEGKNIFIEHRSAEGKLNVPALADELVRLKVDVIVAISTSSALAAKNATK